MSDETLIKLLAKFGKPVFEYVEAQKLNTGAFPNIHKPIDLTSESDKTLIESVKKSGIISPFILDEKYNIIDGNRRFSVLKIIYGDVTNIPKIPAIRVIGLDCTKNELDCAKIAFIVNKHRREVDEEQFIEIIKQVAKKFGCELYRGRNINYNCIKMVADALGATSEDENYIAMLVNKMVTSALPAYVVKPAEQEIKPTVEAEDVKVSDDVIVKLMMDMMKSSTSKEGRPKEEQVSEEERNKRRLACQFGIALANAFGLDVTELSNLLVSMMSEDPTTKANFVKFIYTKCVDLGICQ